MIRIAPCAPICQSGGMRRKERKEPASVRVMRADHGTDGRDPPADELAAAEDHAGDREQRVAQRDVGVGRGGEPDQRQARQHAEEAGQRRT